MKSLLIIFAATLFISVQGEINVANLLSTLTNAQKCAQMTQVTFDVVGKDRLPDDPDENPLDIAKLAEAIVKLEVGSILNAPHNTALKASTWQKVIRTILDMSIHNTTGKIPVIYGIDSIHGANYVRESVLFPQPLSMAASFNVEIARRVGAITALETRATGIPWNFNPVLDVGRQPVWSRYFETYGEDSFVGSKMGEAYIKGHQGTSLKDRKFAATCMKHYIGYSMPFNGRDRSVAYIPDNLLREVFLPPFAHAVKAGAPTVMVNSGDVNGLPGHANSYYINDILKGELGFKGFVVSDWEDIKRLHTRDNIAETPEEAVRIAVMAGLDMSMVPYDYSFYYHCVNLTEKNPKFLERVNDAVSRILTVKNDLGLFDADPYPKESDLSNVGTQESEDFNLEAARESIILAKNQNKRLPLSKNARILVTGPTSNLLRVLCGAWSYSWQGNTDGDGYFVNFGRKKNTVLDSIRNKAVNVEFSQGADLSQTVNPSMIQAAVEAARNKDVIILCIGEETYTEQPGVINNIMIDQPQLALAEELFKLNIPVVVVYLGGRPRVITSIVNKADAVILGFLPGNKGSEALADIIFGDTNPSGKLPVTYPLSTNGFVTYDYHPLEKFEFNGYENLFPFGHGMSYTTFSYSDLKLSATEIRPTETLTVSVTVKNTGDRRGKETIILYLNDAYSSISRPMRLVKGFTKVDLNAGQEQRVSFTLNIEDMKFINPKGQRVYEVGEFNVYIENLEAKFYLTDAAAPTTTTTTTNKPMTATTSGASSLAGSCLILSSLFLLTQKFF